MQEPFAASDNAPLGAMSHVARPVPGEARSQACRASACTPDQALKETPPTEKYASVHWEGLGKKGLGQISTETAALKAYP